MTPPGLDSYLRRLPPPLTDEAEIRHCLDCIDQSHCLETLVAGNVRLVVSFARRYWHPGVELDDLVQVGTIGLIEGLRRFDPDRNVKLSTYAAFFIRAAMRDWLAANRFAVALPREAAALLHTAPDDARALDAARFSGTRTVRESDAYAGDTPEAVIEAAALRELVGELVNRLDERKRLVVMHRYEIGVADPLGVGALAAELGLSREWVRQLHQLALSELHSAALDCDVVAWLR